MKIPSFFTGKNIVTLFFFHGYAEQNDTFGSEFLLFARESRSESECLKSAENTAYSAVFAGWVQMNPLINPVGSNSEE